MSEIVDAKLVIKIDHSDPISLVDLTVGLNSIASLYNDFTKNDKKAQLLVTEINKGSIAIDLITASAASTIPLISNVNNVVQFCHYIKLLIAICKKSNTETIESLINDNHLPTPSSKNIKDFSKSINIISKPKDKVDIKTQDINTGQIFNHCVFNGVDTSEMLKNIPDLIDENITYEYKKQLFEWVQTNFSELKTGNKGLIRNIHQKSLRVIFDNETIKKEMTTKSDDGINWQNKYYTVDVELQVEKNNKPVRYKILKNYAEDSFPIEND